MKLAAFYLTALLCSLLWLLAVFSALRWAPFAYVITGACGHCWEGSFNSHCVCHLLPVMVDSSRGKKACILLNMGKLNRYRTRRGRDPLSRTFHRRRIDQVAVSCSRCVLSTLMCSFRAA
ncbi:hypothetical protein B0T16DRAFT_33161 [Cercophora newfieldiana]|uniref:Uncharacterized protein n=1 Tax=Cercophora newfieldiana TaxID=92897 RepID=A0AA39YPE8_9PEZI|nr:hypothetical protein B0T16DRAFT_33161 [Cercophora newfieldiana]